MGRPKHHYIVVDTETTIDGKVADIGAVIVDRKGNVKAKMAVLVRGVYDKPRKHTLFHNEEAGTLWNKASLARRYGNYNALLESGERQFATILGINSWLEKAVNAYDPILTAYNLPFDRKHCEQTDIDLSIFKHSFCLWKAAYTAWAHTKGYREFALACHAFNKPTDYGNMSYRTNAETMARFALGQPDLEDEPHTAYEDALLYEVPILLALIRQGWTSKRMLGKLEAYNWRDCQVRDHFTAKREKRKLKAA